MTFEKIPYKIYLTEDGRYEDQARPSAEPRHRHAHGLR